MEDLPAQDGSWVYISFHLLVPPSLCAAFPAHDMTLSLLGTPTPTPPLAFASPQTLSYSSRVAKCWGNNSPIILVALPWFRNHHWPAREEVWERSSRSLAVSSQGCGTGSETANRRDAMGCIPHSSDLMMSRNLRTPNVSRLQLFSLSTINHILDKVAPVLHILKQI